ncbi:unnamed protein product [Caenorhabditis angaria]|uniref:G-protein coupled receptors family 1 profile domain-containing protein n=1 Tax=Caenorhabditis angaria TaxID=860376 RepID=A0A9P1IX75_9PELO|nr:unnamed protein product [Caenorhabditis angaria]
MINLTEIMMNITEAMIENSIGEDGYEEASPQDESEDSEKFRIKIETCIYVICFLVGGPLNVLSLVRSLQAFRAHKAKSQILLLRINLNMADLFTLFLFIPKQVIWLQTYQWYGGEILCRVCAFFSTFSFYLHAFVISCIAIDRAFGAYNISSINAHRRAYNRCRNMLCVAWTLAILISLPQAVVFQTTSPFLATGDDFTQCATVFMIFRHEKLNEYMQIGTSDIRKMQIEQQAESVFFWEKVYAVNHFLFVFWIPFIIIIFSYGIVLLILQGHLKQEKKSSCFKCRVKSLDMEEDSVAGTPTKETYLLQQDESYALKTWSRENIHIDFDSQSNVKRNGSVKSRTIPHPVPSTTRFGAMAVSTIHKAKQHAKRQATQIILAYVCVWSPYNFMTVLGVLGMEINYLGFFNAAMCVNTMINPIIYGVIRNIKR